MGSGTAGRRESANTVQAGAFQQWHCMPKAGGLQGLLGWRVYGSKGTAEEDGLETVPGSGTTPVQEHLTQCPEPLGASGKKRVRGGEGYSWRRKEETT